MLPPMAPKNISLNENSLLGSFTVYFITQIYLVWSIHNNVKIVNYG